MSKFFTVIFFTLALLGIVLASPTPHVEKRDITSILSDLGGITSILSSLDGGLGGLTGGNSTTADPTQIAGITSLIGELTSMLNLGAADTTAASPLSILDSLALLGSLTGMATELTSVLGGLTSLSGVLSGGGLGLTNLQALNTASTSFTNALSAGSALGIVTVVESLLAPITPAFSSLLAAFGGV